MATYSQIHQGWLKDSGVFTIRNGASWVFPPIWVRQGGSWVDATDYNSSGPHILTRSGGLWVSVMLDEWEISVCRASPGTSINEYTIPSSIFGLSVNKVITRAQTGSNLYPRIFSKQYGGGTAFTHAFTKNGSHVYALTGKVDDGYTCASGDNRWTDRGQFPSGTTFVPGDKVGAKVVVPNTVGNDYGGTRIRLLVQWYFN